MNRRKFLGILAGAAAGAPFLADSAVSNFPQLQGSKNKLLPFSNRQHQYDQPTAAEAADLQPIERPQIHNQRDTLEDKIAELIITDRGSIGSFFPGGIILTKQQTREGHLFGKYHSYDPERAQSTVEDVLKSAAQMNKRVLIYDEGEGGFVTRIGTLPAAGDIGNYYVHNRIRGTITGRVTPSSDKNTRKNQIVALFENYAKELHNRGVNAVLGPVLDVIISGKNDNLIERDGRSFGPSHAATVDLAQMYINAMHRYGIRVTGKHFLGAGIPKNGDVHEELVTQTRRIRPRLNAGSVYRRLREGLDGVMATHIRNPADNNKPYILSEVALDYLTQTKYQDDGRTYRGIDFNGLVITDDILMKGVLEYVKRNKLTKRQQKLVAGCSNLESKTAVLAIDAGCNAVIALQTDVDSIVRGISYAYKTGDSKFKNRVDNSFRKYQEFVQKFNLN
ncbi:MAG: glycoside hydrolase family 3 N-terminal domain-containing protein [Nanoarchaeota archaeon]